MEEGGVDGVEGAEGEAGDEVGDVEPDVVRESGSHAALAFSPGLLKSAPRCHMQLN